MYRPRTARTLQCLYCDSELKPFRGLFDEDFCCRDHRDKYFSSFRKSLNRLPALLTPVAGPEQPPSLPVSQPVFSADVPKMLAETPGLPHTETLPTADDRDAPAGNPFAPPLAIPVEPEAP